MPEPKNCRRCGRIFTYIGGAPLCPDCRQLDEDDFKKVKDYLYDNPGSSISQISIELDVSVEKIRRFLKEGRLEIVGGEGNLVLECERCGKSIKSGRFCDDCEKELSNGLKGAAAKLGSASQQAAAKKAGIRYLSKEEQSGRKIDRE